VLKFRRDLATNWNIDIASELTEYLHELEHLSIKFSQVADDGTSQDSSLNFAEGNGVRLKVLNPTSLGLLADVVAFAFRASVAALLIQGSTCVYSKKVEYLYSLVFQTLDIFIQQRYVISSPVILTEMCA